MPVYIQCKASGGGRDQHGKNIQNRAKEQIARGLFYRCTVSNDEIAFMPQKFYWISVLDGDWGVTEDNPLKYVHMLELAGYKKTFCARDLLTPTLQVKRKDNPLATFLADVLKCRKMN